jgi:hypothetical protein
MLGGIKGSCCKFKLKFTEIKVNVDVKQKKIQEEKDDIAAV